MLYKYLFRRLGGMIAFMFLVFFLLTIIYLSLRYSTPGRLNIPLQLSIQLFATHITRYIPEITAMAVFLAVLLCYARLSDDNELLAMAGLGFGPKQHVSVILCWGLPITAVIATITLAVDHHVETRYDRIKEQARQSTPQSQWIRAGHFHSFKDGTLYFKQRDGDTLEHVFFYRQDRYGKTVTTARQARVVTGKDNTISVICQGGAHYQLSNDGPDIMMRFNRYTISLDYQPPIAGRKKITDTDTMSPFMLINRDGPEYRSALYERLSPIITVLLLPLLAFVLSYSPRRQHPHYAIVIAGIGLLITYYGMQKLSEAWLADNIVPPLTGSAWAHGLIVVLIAVGWQRLAQGSTGWPRLYSSQQEN